MRGHTRFRWIAVIVAGVLAIPAGAFAHAIYEGWIAVWDPGDGRCLNEKTTIDHGSTGHGKWLNENDAEKIANTPVGPVYCARKWSRPPGYLRIRVIALKWLPKRAEWGICLDSGYRKSAVTAYGQTIFYKGGDSGVPCGAGHYLTKGYAHILVDGDWEGGRLVTSESHYLPS